MSFVLQIIKQSVGHVKIQMVPEPSRINLLASPSYKQEMEDKEKTLQIIFRKWSRFMERGVDEELFFHQHVSSCPMYLCILGNSVITEAHVS